MGILLRHLQLFIFSLLSLLIVAVNDLSAQESQEHDPAVFSGVIRVFDTVLELRQFMVQLQTLSTPDYFDTFAVDSEDQSEKVELYPNFPNPFSGTTTISFQLPEEMPVVLAVYNIVGQRVTDLFDDIGHSGRNEVVWEALEAPSGIYIVRLETPRSVHTRKITLVR